MHIFDPHLSLKANWLSADDIAFAAWDFAGHEHREKYRDSGGALAQSAWLEAEGFRMLTGALADGQLVALGISPDDDSFGIGEIPQNLFLSAELQIDPHKSAIYALGRKFSDVRICRASGANPAKASEAHPSGRPSSLAIVRETWEALKSAKPNFLTMPKSTQNIEIQEKAAELFPARFPGHARIGESTIRRHRRKHPDLFT